VLDRALDEALSGFTAKEAAFYRLDLDGRVRELSQQWDDVNFIDSPLQNLALFRDAADGRSVLRDVGIVTDNNTLLAVFLGTAFGQDDSDHCGHGHCRIDDAGLPA